MEYNSSESDQQKIRSSSEDGMQPPQINPAVPHHGGSGEVCQNIGAGGDADTGSDGSLCRACRPHQVAGERDEDDEEASSIHGDEGLEDHKVRVEGHGRIGLRAIFGALARHEDCDCHPDDVWQVTTSNAPARSGMQTPYSTTTELGSSEHSLASSRVLEIARSQSPTELLRFIGNAFADNVLPTNPISLFTTQPLALIPEWIFARNTHVPVHYPLELSISMSEGYPTDTIMG